MLRFILINSIKFDWQVSKSVGKGYYSCRSFIILKAAVQSMGHFVMLNKLKNRVTFISIKAFRCSGILSKVQCLKL